MSLFRLDPESVKYLVDQPESGMGYQIVKDEGRAVYMVFNATIAIPLEQFRSVGFSEEDYLILSGDPDRDPLADLTTIRLAHATVCFSLFDATLRGSDAFGLSFADNVIAPPESAISPKVPRSYYRYCAYYRDRRIESNGNFRPGTYATTYADMHFVPSGFAAVGRYAIPNPASARYVFHLVTFHRPSLMGTATPNFGQAGGGVEVLFSTGAANCSGNSFPIPVG